MVQSMFTVAAPPAARVPRCGSTKTPAPMRAIARDTTIPTSINGENRLRCIGRVLNGLRRSLRIISYLFLFLKIRAYFAGQVPKTFFGIAMLNSPQLCGSISSNCCRILRIAPLKRFLFLLFQPGKSSKHLSICRPVAESAYKTNKISSLTTRQLYS